MLGIIYKDFMLQRKNLKFAFLYIILITFMCIFMNGDIQPFLITTVTLVFFYFGGTLQEESKFNYTRLVASLPVKRHVIAICYYLEVIIFMIISLILCTLMLSIASEIFQRQLIVITFGEFAKVISATLLLSSASIPLILRFDYNFSRFFVFILYFAFFTLGSNSSISTLQLPLINNIIVILMVSIGIFFISMLSSVFILSNKEM